MSLPLFAPLQRINDKRLSQSGIDLQVLRLDQYSPQLSGNKYFKLKLNLEAARSQGFSRLVSFGGAFSNHIHAVAKAGQYYGFSTMGFIRGEEHYPLNSTLQDAVDAGMQLHYLSREDYRLKSTTNFIRLLPDALREAYQNAYIIPEGGSNLLGVKGCMEIVEHIHQQIDREYDAIVVPCGTAATLAGIAAAVPADKQVIGISVLKNSQYLELECQRYIEAVMVKPIHCWQILHEFHHGGYAKTSQALISFIADFFDQHGIPLDPVYSGKMFYGLFQLLSQRTSLLPKGLRVVAIHTGGLQGARGFKGQRQRPVAAKLLA